MTPKMYLAVLGFIFWFVYPVAAVFVQSYTGRFSWVMTIWGGLVGVGCMWAMADALPTRSRSPR